jgi:hypothetical protein
VRSYLIRPKKWGAVYLLSEGLFSTVHGHEKGFQKLLGIGLLCFRTALQEKKQRIGGGVLHRSKENVIRGKT